MDQKPKLSYTEEDEEGLHFENASFQVKDTKKNKKLLYVVIAAITLLLITLFIFRIQSQSSLAQLQNQIKELKEEVKKSNLDIKKELEQQIAAYQQLKIDVEKSNLDIKKELEGQIAAHEQLKKDIKKNQLKIKQELEQQIAAHKQLKNDVEKSQLHDDLSEELEINEEQLKTPYVVRTITTLKPKKPQLPQEKINLQDEETILNYFKKFNNPLDFALELYKHPDNQLALQAEYLTLDKSFSIGKEFEELPICITANGYNLIRNNVYLALLESIDNQNYSNYQLFMVDDASTDDTENLVKKKVLQYPRLRQRTTFIRNHQNIGALANKYLTINEHCSKGSIVFEIDADDALIGRQVMKLMNVLYQTSDDWFIYSNFVWKMPKGHRKGLSRPISPQILAANSYRTSQSWVTSALRTFKRELYTKIPQEYFFESENKFLVQTSDHFEMYDLVELAGPKHIRNIPNFLYYYTGGSHDRCGDLLVAHYSSISRIQTPLLPLESLDSPAKITPDYVVPQKCLKAYQKSKRQLEAQCKH